VPQSFISAATAALAALWLAACGTSIAPDAVVDMNAIAERYVKLVLAAGEHDPAFVDAYYGPPDWKTEVSARKLALAEIDRQASELLAGLNTSGGSGGPGGEDEMVSLRHQYLMKQLGAMRARIGMLSGVKMTFDEESRALYDAVAPTYSESHFQATLDELDRLLPGPGPLIDRYDRFQKDFIVPPDRVSRVFDLAIAECRRRSLPHIQLPPEESFTVEFVTGKSWSGYDWYQGGFKSLIQVNTDLPIYADRAIDLACHEGYPGHHVYNALLEKHLMRERGWVEASVYALFSPQSLIAEGTANYGIEVAFTDAERLQFERDVLFPAAGLNPTRAEEFFKVFGLVDRLSYAGNEAARRYLNGEIDRAAASAWLSQFAMMSPARAEQRTRFFDDYRSYVINYNLGKDLVKRYIESRAGAAADSARRWREFVALLGSPRLPSGLDSGSR
jgi:hypothetical protein